eukprot:gene8216-biopygen13650
MSKTMSTRFEDKVGNHGHVHVAAGAASGTVEGAPTATAPRVPPQLAPKAPCGRISSKHLRAACAVRACEEGAYYERFFFT